MMVILNFGKLKGVIMKNFSSSFKLLFLRTFSIIGVFVALAILFLCYDFLQVVKAEEVEFNIVQEEVDGVKTFRLNNILSLDQSPMTRNASNDPIEEFAKQHPYGFNEQEAKESNFVVYQEQTLAAQDFDGESEWSDDEGYLTIYTTAYHKGYTITGNARYKVEGEVVFHKTFKLRYEEQFILSHSTAGVFDSNGTEEGNMSYHYYYHNHSAYHNPPEDWEKDVTEELIPSYTQSFGVCFKLQWPTDVKAYNDGAGATKVDHKQIYSNWHLEGSYYVIATNDTNVAVSYVHNENFFANALSVSFGACGISANIDIEGSNTLYSARPILIYNI
ncbi:MAG TPA: hypothetical protein H9851_02545 [Candidatus Borkfalkia faecavium]|uniref:Uncharacterized protein n=1 Tax=Candidatus Borkfalkia faecavium TaxID=2838508 RepID=A0A9D2AV09_9FIRM|nr:hypothetical protein [Candidatus Borkfalkia faecavium]